ncbi:hypothetical protein BSLG_001258 [Batrachochytrium salamandrivorans]|nr:hypothetical protein BSLG_001258 [Batrachochytrium salamandrivorans]
MCFHKALALFQNRATFANSRNDRTVRYTTAAIMSTNLFTRFKEIKLDPVEYPNIVFPSKTEPWEKEPWESAPSPTSLSGMEIATSTAGEGKNSETNTNALRLIPDTAHPIAKSDPKKQRECMISSLNSRVASS